MCSTPKPKAAVKGRQGNNETLLSNMSTEARKRFAERANKAQEKRDEQTHRGNQGIVTTPISQRYKMTQRSKYSNINLCYWLLHGNLKGILYWILFGKSNLSK